MILVLQAGAADPITYVLIFGGVALVGGLLYLAHRLEKAGYLPKAHAVTNRAVDAAAEINAMLQPAHRHVLNAKREQRKKNDGQGDDDED